MLNRELSIFLLVGLLTVAIDFSSYRVLLYFSSTGVAIAKAIGFLLGTLFAYFANRFWTFGHRSPAPGSWWRFGVWYSATLGANVLINSLVLQIGAQLLVAFGLATAVSAMLNFVGMKLFVFKSATPGRT